MGIVSSSVQTLLYITKLLPQLATCGTGVDATLATLSFLCSGPSSLFSFTLVSSPPGGVAFSGVGFFLSANGFRKRSGTPFAAKVPLPIQAPSRRLHL